MSQSLDESLAFVQADAADRVHEMLLLAQRLRASEGSELDDNSISAVAEATGASADYVRLVLRTIPVEAKKRSIWENWKASYLSFDPDVRRYVSGGLLGIGGALLVLLNQSLRDGSGLMNMLALCTIVGGVWNAGGATRSLKASIVSGAIQGSVMALALAFFAFVYQAIYPLLIFSHLSPGSPLHTQSFWLVSGLFGGAITGGLVFSVIGANRQKLGLTDPVQERHRMIQQLMEIREKLKSDEERVTFISVDIVGSTRMKEVSDPLDIEYTFNEYHQYVEQVTLKHQGRVHSTAGDGVTCVFSSAQGGLQAAKAIMAGLFEFNAFRNRLDQPIELRAGVHTGSVLAPGKEVTNVNFAHVIDIAAHMQKVAPIGALVVSEETANSGCGGMTSISEEHIEVDGLRGAVWRPARRAVPVFAGKTN